VVVFLIYLVRRLMGEPNRMVAAGYEKSKFAGFSRVVQFGKLGFLTTCSGWPPLERRKALLIKIASSYPVLTKIGTIYGLALPRT
jgi:hypothetical protein